MKYYTFYNLDRVDIDKSCYLVMREKKRYEKDGTKFVFIVGSAYHVVTVW